MFVIEKLNDLRLSAKLLLIQLFCVIIPLLATDTILVCSIVKAEEISNLKEEKDVADAISYTVSNTFETNIVLLQNIYTNQYINNFIAMDFDSPLAYYREYLNFKKNSLYEIIVASGPLRAAVYVDNPTILNGGFFKRTEVIEKSPWYAKCLQERFATTMVFDYAAYLGRTEQRHISLLRVMDFYHKGQGKNVLRVDVDYSKLLRDIMSAHYEPLVYVCVDGKIVLSNEQKGGVTAPFEDLTTKIVTQAAYTKSFIVLNKKFSVYVMPVQTVKLNVVKDHAGIIVAFVLVNIFLPFVFMYLVNKSFTVRLQKLDNVVSEEVHSEGQLNVFEGTYGNDEIGKLIENYNKMALRMNAMIENEYRNKLRQQETNIARQKAELLALHSQINPHFLFNALECIRMHSLIKDEQETAEMVEKLAVMVRQNTEWVHDTVKIKDEIQFIEAYFDLQKYRFGDRLNYKIEVEDCARDYLVPKLGIVTFAENASVHGTERKGEPSWIYVRAFADVQNLHIEVEDTGAGMTEDELSSLQDKIKHVSIESIQQNSKIGILNAVLRLNLLYDDCVEIAVASEKNKGTLVSIQIPLESADIMRSLTEGDYGKSFTC